MTKKYNVSSQDLKMLNLTIDQIFNYFRFTKLTKDEYYIVLVLLIQWERRLHDIQIPSMESMVEDPLFSDWRYYNMNININESNIINHVFKSVYDNLDDITKVAYFSFFENMNSEYLIEFFPEIFERILNQIIDKSSRQFGDYMLPNEISRFMCNLAELQEQAHIYNPFSGLSSFALNFNKNKQSYYGQEINHIAWSLGVLRLIANRRNSYTITKPEDSTTNWNPWVDSVSGLKQEFDLVISSPPFRKSVELSGQIAPSYFQSYEQLIIEKGLDSLKPDGKIILLVQNGFLSRQQTLSLRKRLVKENLLEMVISLPKNILPKTNIQTSILVINKLPKKDKFVRFISAQSYILNKKNNSVVLDDKLLLSEIKKFENTNNFKSVPTKKLEKLDFNLTVQRHFLKKYDGLQLKNILSSTPIERSGVYRKGLFVRIRDLKDDILDYSLDLTKAGEIVVPNHARMISSSCLLIANRWKTLKPTYFNFVGTPIYVTHDIHTFIVNENKVDIDFLIGELHTTYVKEQVDALRVGGVIPTLRKEDFLSISISISNEEEQNLSLQKNIVRRRIQNLAADQANKLSLFTEIHGLKSELHEQNTFLRHTLAGPTSNLKSAIDNIQSILKPIFEAQPELKLLKVSDKHVKTLVDYLNILERDAIKIVNTVKDQLRVDERIDSNELQSVEIFNFLKAFESECKDRVDLNYVLTFEYDLNLFTDVHGSIIPIYIWANEELLGTVLSNLIENASKHAFEKETKNRIELFLELVSSKSENDSIRLSISNNGKPLPEDFNLNHFVRRGTKMSNSTGDGFGGWLINEIVKKFEGQLHLVDLNKENGNNHSEFVTRFDIILPIFEIDENE